MHAVTALARLREPIATRSQLLRAGALPLDLTDAVRSGALIRVRRGYYARADAPAKLVQAVRVGGRLGCVSAAESLGVWVLDHPFAHIQMRHEASRLRSPRNRFRPLSDETIDGCELHWWPVSGAGSVHTVACVDALAHIIRCQSPTLAIAALDSALYQRLIDPGGLDLVFDTVPAKHAGLRARLEPRCMSGIELIFRLALTAAGIPFEVQAEFAGVGRVDFLVDGCVVVETDGKLGHADEVSKARDYARDAALEALGYTVVRLNYLQVVFQPEAAMAAVRGALAAHRRSTSR
jgi:very-short-patch-repair endonuclease